MATLRLSPALLYEMATHARRGFPEETCGVLLGTADGAAVSVIELMRARNVADECLEAYALDGAAMLRAEQRARMLGVQVVGVWHSHPDAPPVPSESDRAAAWPGWSYLIMSVGRSGALDLRSWRLESQQFIEEMVTPCPM
jgi:proteasome lid subunit RPN8/RPN11